jgi:copper chaperone NosL
MMRGLLVSCMLLTGCAGPSPAPVAIRIGEDACAFCRMTIVSVSTAAQVVRPGEEPVMFDEIGCLQQYLAGTTIPDSATVFVADHRTGAWVNANDAVFTKTATQTPMSSGLLAHADAASKDADSAASGGAPVTTASMIGAAQRSNVR